MLRAEEFSMKVDLLRLQCWAEKQTLNAVERACLENIEDAMRLEALLNLLLKRSFDTKNFGFTMIHEQHLRHFLIGVDELVDVADFAKNEQCVSALEQLNFPMPTKENPQIIFRYYDYTKSEWIGASEYKKLESDLSFYQTITTQTNYTNKNTSRTSSAFERKIQWLQSLKQSQLDEATQNRYAQEIMQSIVPEETVKVEPKEGESLQQALLNAIRFSSTAPSDPPPECT